MTTPAACCERCGRVGVAGSAAVEVMRVDSSTRIGPRPLCGPCLRRILRWINAPSRPPGWRSARRAVVDHAAFQTRGGPAPAFTPGKHP